MRKSGFTLIEVNLAMFIMAVGTLGLVSLYSFGYRENQQSNEDVRAAAVAQMNMNAMVAALSSTNMTWSQWQAIGMHPANGWGTYAGDGTGSETSGIGENDGTAKATPLQNPNGEAGSAFQAVMSAAGASGSFDPQDMKVAIVVAPDDVNCPRRYSVAIRVGSRTGSLVYQPLYYTEVAFQGLKGN